MRFVRDEYRVYLSVTELAAYAYQRENVRVMTEKFGFVRVNADSDGIPSEFDVAETSLSPVEHGTSLHHAYETDAVSEPGVTTEVPLELSVFSGEYSVCVQGFADSISFDGRNHTVEEVKTLASFPRGLTPFSDPAHFAQAAIYAHLYAERYELPLVFVKLTFLRRSDGERISFAAPFTRIALSRMFESLLARAHPFIEIFARRMTDFPEQAKKMPFPYRSIRGWQTKFIQRAYSAMKHGHNLLVSAPTGIGKTMSSLFPAVKALGDGIADRVFYLTAKTVTGRAALDAAALLQKHVPELRCVMLLAKEQMCPSKKEMPELSSSLRCRMCEKTDSITDDLGRTYISYRERELAALTSLLMRDERLYTTESIVKTAAEHRVCPYELALDLSEHCPLIVCDYNYVTDERVRLRRYFKDVSRGEKYIFLFDEAHNLPDRVTSAYSAVLEPSLPDALSAVAARELLGDGDFLALTEEFSRSLAKCRRMCTESEYLMHTDDGEEIPCGYFEGTEIPANLAQSAERLAKYIGKLIRDGSEFTEVLDPLYSALSRAVSVVPFFDEKFRFFAHREGERVTVELLCIDPSGMIEKMISPAVSTVMFSATLSPMDYYREVTGQRHGETLELDSPYERDNLCLIAYDGISTRYSDRKATAEDCAEIIARCVEAREGNYMVYFPSYDYMKRVARRFRDIMPDAPMILQKPGMSFGERERFIRLFRSQKRAIVGFCVLGGMFSEGIDLAGESLIGSIIVGTGMPQLSAEQNIMAAYYDEKTERGHEFAYVCPGMNKVLQAAGRVIRSEDDRGVVLLIDDRYAEPSMRCLYPRHWRHMRFTADPDSLTAMLDEFWCGDGEAPAGTDRRF